MAKLTKKEKAWVAEVNKLLAACPSKRIGFATVGDFDVFLFDMGKRDAIDNYQDRNNKDFVPSADKLGALFEETLTFPNQVESTAG